MIIVVKCYEHGIKPLVVETFKGCNAQVQRNAIELAAILSRKNNCEYKVFVDLSRVPVIDARDREE